MSVSELELRRGLEPADLDDVRGERCRILRESLSAESALPLSFGLSELRETDEYIYAVGRSEELCFFKDPQAISSGALRETTSCFERYAPGVLVGRRSYRLHGAHIVWLGEVHGQGPRERKNADSHDVMLVLRRLPEQTSLTALLADGEKRSAKVSKILGGFLRSSVEKNRYRAALQFAEDPRRTGRALSARVENLQEQVRARMSTMSELQTLSLLEAVSFLRGSLAQAEPVLAERGAVGFVGESHGALSADRIYIEDLSSTAPRVACLDWLPRSAPEAYTDLLSDAAGLCLDLQTRGFSQTAERLESLLLRVEEPRVRRFYLVLQTLELCFRDIRPRPELVCRALVQALDLEGRRCAVVVDGASDERRRDLIDRLKDFSGFHPVDRQELSLASSPELVIEERLRAAAAAVREGVSVIMDGGCQLSKSGEQLIQEGMHRAGAQLLRLTGRIPLSTDPLIMLRGGESTGRYVYAGEELPAAEAALVALRTFARFTDGN